MQAIIDVHVGVVSASVVLDRVLNELEAGNAGSIEREMVGTASVAHGQRVHTKIGEWLHPRFEDRQYCGILLHINAADFAGAIVHVEVC